MGRKPIECPSCKELYGGQGKICWNCHIGKMNEKRSKSNRCPECGEYKNRQSKTCQKCYLNKIKRPKNYIDNICPICGSEFTVHKTQTERGQGIYCSRSCARSGSPTRKRTRKKLKCCVCGKEFEKHLSEIKRRIGDNDFCNVECWYLYNHGENHYGYTGKTPERQRVASSRKWKNTVKKVWARDCGYCQNCGINKYDHDGSMHIHHIVSFAVKSLRFKVSNLILLCDECHWWVHSNDNVNKKFIRHIVE